MSIDIEDAKECCFKILKINFAFGWKNAVLSNMKFKRIFGGCTSFLFCCSDEDCQPKKVLFRFFRSNDEDSHFYDLKFIGESAETLVFYILSKLNFGPKLYSTFNGGRIEEFIDGNILTRYDVLNKTYNETIIRKIAYFHSLKIPILKDDQWLNRFFNIFINDFNKLNIERLNNVSQITLKNELLNFDLKNEFIWFKNFVSKLKCRIVFSHNDLTKRNIMIKNEDLNLNDKVIIIDFGDCAYNYRGLDLANFLRCKVYKDNLQSIENYDLHIYNEDEIKKMCECYLSEFKIHFSDFDEGIDNIEVFEKEVHFFLLLSDLITILYLVFNCIFQKSINDEKNLEYTLNRISLYKYTKKNFFIKY